MKKIILIFSIVILITQNAYTKDVAKEDSSTKIVPKVKQINQEKVDIVDPKIHRIPDKTSEDFCKKYPTLC
jgi:hypothetical protein